MDSAVSMLIFALAGESFQAGGPGGFGGLVFIAGGGFIANAGLPTIPAEGALVFGATTGGTFLIPAAAGCVLVFNGFNFVFVSSTDMPSRGDCTGTSLGGGAAGWAMLMGGTTGAGGLTDSSLDGPRTCGGPMGSGFGSMTLGGSMGIGFGSIGCG